ncbi:hypothetical protein L0128_07335 [candidate division KSB1 bacterium]|nr:hypothetical protein [candidate division KSB1 bacterium]
MQENSLFFCLLLLFCLMLFTRALPMNPTPAPDLKYETDRFSRLIHIHYTVPAKAAPVISVSVTVFNPATKTWQPARVQKYRSATAGNLCPATEWDAEMLTGAMTEFNAGGLRRTCIWNPWPEFVQAGKIEARLRVELVWERSKSVRGEIQIQTELADVIYLEDWRAVLQSQLVQTQPVKDAAQWWFHEQEPTPKAPVNNRCLDVAQKGILLPQLTYLLNLRGQYALFVCLPENLSAIELRLSGDESAQFFQSTRFRQEQFWKIAKLDYQHLIIRQPYRTVFQFEDHYRARLDYVKLVPVSDALAESLENWSKGPRDKLVLGYNEPYSWAFHENVQSNLQHREPLIDFQAARLDIIDIQIGRLGARPIFESRNEPALFWGTRGDPVRGNIPETNNVGRMQQYTNTLQSQLKYARELGLSPFANYGAGNSYHGSPLHGEFAAAHPDWHAGEQMRYDIPAVQEHLLQFYREALEIGAGGVSIDFCRYPHGQTSAEICTQFLRNLRQLTTEFSTRQGKLIPINVRFPAQGVIRWEWFDFQTWCREGLIDYLCPSNLQARHFNFDLTPYVAAVKNTPVKLCPVVDALHWGLSRPGEFLQRVRRLYQDGADGIYIYQCDAAVHESEISRQMVRACGSTSALQTFFENAAQDLPRQSKAIYLKAPTYGAKYNRWERIRIWVDGLEPTELQVWLDGKLINQFQQPPYWVGAEGYESDQLLSGEHQLTIRARDGVTWLEKTVTIQGE